MSAGRHPRGAEELKAAARELGFSNVMDLLVLARKNDPPVCGGPTDWRSRVADRRVRPAASIGLVYLSAGYPLRAGAVQRLAAAGGARDAVISSERHPARRSAAVCVPPV
jgi:hypothetical protein